MTDRGYQLLALGFDWSLLQRGAAAVLPESCPTWADR
jgi:hypothetical protein